MNVMLAMLKDDSGAALVEYSLVTALLFLTIYAALVGTNDSANNSLNHHSSCMHNYGMDPRSFEGAASVSGSSC